MKKNLVFIHPHFTIPGGAGRVVLELAKRLSPKFNVTVIALKINGEYFKEYPQIKFISLNGPITSSFKFWLNFFHWQNQLFTTLDSITTKPSTIISSIFPANWLALPYKNRNPHVKMIWYCHEPSAFIHIKKWRQAINDPIKRFLSNLLAPLFSLIDRHIANYADLLLANSQFGASLVSQIYHRIPTIIYPGTNTKIYHPISFNKKQNTIITISRLTKFKNIDILIKAFSNIADKTYKLIIIGDGENKVNLQRLAHSLNLSDRIKILSGLTNLQLINLVAKAKIFVLCSKNEPFGIVPVEAMSCGTPAIVDNSGGPKETVIDNVTGKVIDMTPKNLSQTLDKLISNSSLLKNMSVNARKQSLKFDWSKSVDSLVKYL